ncbi:MAG TPA: retroviral-like aspartic protease family protein [Vicinamibacterales bacterium]|nr:retroviral-like aspartic protease family protein [Vicinamibacterales bacterium]
MLLSAAILVLSTPRVWASSSTPFQLGRQGGVIVPVILNGQGPFTMLLDTGASHSAITDDVATAIGARAIARSTVITTTGNTLRAIVSIERVSIGPISAEHVLPSVVPARAFDENGDIQGLIGQDVLAWLRYTLDFRRRAVEWHDGATGVHGTQLSLAFEHGRFLVCLPQERTTLRLVPDSGAGAFVMYEFADRAAFKIVETGATAELSSAGGRRTARHVRLRQLRLGDRVMRNVPAIAIRRGDHHPAEGDGLLPLHLFERVTFDGPGRVLILG